MWENNEMLSKTYCIILYTMSILCNISCYIEQLERTVGFLQPRLMALVSITQLLIPAQQNTKLDF